MQETINGYVVTFTLDTDGKVIKISIPVEILGYPEQGVSFEYGVALENARLIAMIIIASLPVHP